VHPYKVDVQNLTSILALFGEVTGLDMVVPIRCHVIDLDDILGGLPLIRSSFPMKYLGLPLSVWQLKRVDIQPLEDKMASKLVTWDGKNINAAGRGALVKILPHLSSNFPPYSTQHSTGLPCLHEED
jgi:hypothetical protein